MFYAVIIIIIDNTNTHTTHFRDTSFMYDSG